MEKIVGISVTRRLAIALAPIAMLGGCGAVLGSSTQEITVESEPPGAACGVWRQGVRLVRDFTAPASVTVERQSATLHVACVVDGSTPRVMVLTPNQDGALVASIFLSLLVGIPINTRSRKDNQYPERVIVPVPPASFPSDGDRAFWFAAARANIERRTGEEIAKVHKSCGDNAALCDADSRKFTNARDAAIDYLERLRTDVRADSSAPRAE